MKRPKGSDNCSSTLHTQSASSFLSSWHTCFFCQLCGSTEEILTKKNLQAIEKTYLEATIGCELSPEACAQADLKLTYGKQKEEQKPKAADIALLMQRNEALLVAFDVVVVETSKEGKVKVDINGKHKLRYGFETHLERAQGSAERSSYIMEMSFFIPFSGDQIHVVCKRDQLKSWKPILKENCTYMMHNFKVVGQYRICAHPYKLIFIGVTVIRKTDLVDVPLKTHNFIKFVDVISDNFERGLLVGECSYSSAPHF
ncbi:hypothetical protein JHK84_050788 [Glycine max]|nr:hypothetical protein JHK84_050788 [Glycine max]